MKKSLVFLFGLIVMMTLGQACGGDDIDCADNAAIQQDINRLVTEVNNALDDFNNDPSDSNCDAVRDSIDDFIDFNESVLECFATDPERQLTQEQIDNARSSRDMLPC